MTRGELEQLKGLLKKLYANVSTPSSKTDIDTVTILVMSLLTFNDGINE